MRIQFGSVVSMIIIQVNLLALSRPELIAAARLIADGKSVTRNKDNCVKAILNHFCNRWAMLTAMDTDDLLDHLSSRSVPLGCTRFRSTILAAEFQALYGESLASALRTPPPLHAFFDMETAALKASEVMSLPWIRAPLHVLTHNLEKLSSAAIQTCLDNLPPPRSVFKMSSHRKTCNALANHIQLRAISLFQAGPSTMADVFYSALSFSPSTTNNPWPLAAQMGDKAEYWADGNGDLLILKFPARLNAHGMYTRIGPYFSLPDSGVSSTIYINCHIELDH